MISQRSGWSECWKGAGVSTETEDGQLPELVLRTLAQLAEEHGVILEFINPGKPKHDAFIERFNQTYRTEILKFYLFRTLNEAREITEPWLTEYDSQWPHFSPPNYIGVAVLFPAYQPTELKSTPNSLLLAP